VHPHPVYGSTMTICLHSSSPHRHVRAHNRAIRVVIRDLRRGWRRSRRTKRSRRGANAITVRRGDTTSWRTTVAFLANPSLLEEVIRWKKAMNLGEGSDFSQSIKCGLRVVRSCGRVIRIISNSDNRGGGRRDEIEEKKKKELTHVPFSRWLDWWLLFQDLGVVVYAIRLLDELVISPRGGPGVQPMAMHIRWRAHTINVNKGRSVYQRGGSKVKWCIRSVSPIGILLLIVEEIIANTRRTPFQSIRPTLDS
jgi:hypothetical protein